LRRAPVDIGLLLKHPFLLLIFWVVFCLPCVTSAQTQFNRSQGGLSVQNLTCDFSVNPLGVDDPSPEFHWNLKRRTARMRGIEQSAFRVLVATSHANLDRDYGDAWDSGKTVTALAPLVSYAGKVLTSDTVYYWKVRVWDKQDMASDWSVDATFLTGLLQPSDWHGRWIAAAADGPRPPQARGNDDTLVESVPALPIFRDRFQVTKPVARATLFISGLGESEALLNDRAVTESVMTPGWTDYRKTVFYDTYDVTSLMHTGSNAIGVMLGNGMYNVQGVKGRYTKFVGSYGQPKLIAELRLHYADGSLSTVSSGDEWRTTPGPIVFSSIYGGEDYDARRAPSDWTLATFDDGDWQRVILVDGPGGKLESEQLPAVKVARTYEPVRVTHPGADISVYDLGQNFAGRPKITVKGPRGSSVRIVPGELLDGSGRVTQASAAVSPKAPVLFNYTLGGDGSERWSPQFMYYGFRYAEVKPTAGTGLGMVQEFDGEALRDAAVTDGTFSSSDHLLNRIHKLIDAAIENNMVSVLTDCPTREKLGWLEQTHLAGPSLMYNFDLSLLYRKMAHDVRDAQLADGMVPSIAPEVVAFLDDAGKNTSFRDSPEWGSAIILSPWTAYTFYGDRQLLRDNYKAMVEYADYLQSRSQDNMISYGLGDWYDIGPGAPGKSQLTGAGMTATAIYFQDLTDLARIASILDQTADAAIFSGRAAAVKASLNAHLFHAASDSYDRGSQTANAMALALGLVPDGHRKGVLDNLVKNIRSHNNHVTAGDIGFHYVVRALSDDGRSDVLYDMLKRTDSPSYGYQLKHGATALTEAWDSNPKSSQDHFMLGHAEEWFYRGLGGIDFDMDRQRDKRIWIHPEVVGDVASAAAEYDSVLGKISSRWQRLGDRLQLDVSVPPGATATISLPAGFRRQVLESGRELRGDSGVLSVDDDAERVSYVVGSGEYHFRGRR
jgi:alpha-L-rhamnosidase